MKIGFIGLGNVGGKLANNLLKSRYRLIVRDLDPKLSKKFNLVDNICRSNKFTDNKTNANWNKNLFFGEIRILRSENKPIEKIKIKRIIKKVLLKFVSISGKSKKKPPTKGIFFLFEKSWCLSPVKFENKFFFLKYMAKKITTREYEKIK